MIEPLTLDNLGDLVAQHKWVAVAAVVIGTLTRLAKSDTKIPIDIPPRYRVWLAFGLGVASGVLEKMVDGGTTWTSAIVGGLISAALAVIGHNTVIDSIRGGKEIVVPGLTIPGVPPAPGKPPSIKPPSPETLPPNSMHTVPPEDEATPTTPTKGS